MTGDQSLSHNDRRSKEAGIRKLIGILDSKARAWISGPVQEFEEG